ncbi:MAG TPA: hypothetical protein VK085_01065 [Pseudogracilibacillus sp.]|nr:hypothetical protein [Pseudogracilibacillus sp.]
MIRQMFFDAMPGFFIPLPKTKYYGRRKEIRPQFSRRVAYLGEKHA